MVTNRIWKTEDRDQQRLRTTNTALAKLSQLGAKVRVGIGLAEDVNSRGQALAIGQSRNVPLVGFDLHASRYRAKAGLNNQETANGMTGYGGRTTDYRLPTSGISNHDHAGDTDRRRSQLLTVLLFAFALPPSCFNSQCLFLKW